MTIYMQGTGPLLVVILTAIALVLIGLLGLAAAIGSVKPWKAGLCIGLVAVVFTGVLVQYGLSGGEFPRIVRRVRLRAVPPVRRDPAASARPAAHSAGMRNT